MASITMDLTASKETYLESSQLFRIFKYEQYIDFETPAFADTLKVYIVSGGIARELTLGTDYIIPERAACDNDTSKAKLVDPTFDKQLISGITMILSPGDTPYTIELSYQRLYPNQIRNAYWHSEQFEWTDELAFEVVKSIDYLKTLTSKVTDVGSLTQSSSILLETDASYSNSNNKITKETHQLNVSGGRFMIHPNGGSFYKDSIKVYFPSTGEYLQEGKDYIIIGMDEAKTKVTTSVVPVYNFLLFTTTINGTVEIDYHAFGGDPTLDNYRELLKNMNSVIQYLNEAQLLSSGNISATPVMTALFERIDKLEDTVRRLQGYPAYGDITNGKYTQMKLYSPSTGLHWFTIATLYTTAGDTTPCIADTFTFRLQSANTHFQFMAAVSADVSNTQGNRLNVDILSENYPRGFIPFKDYSSIDTIIRPQIRLIWNEDGSNSGLKLQLGFELKGIAEETVGIEDLSGHESCWKLVDEIAQATAPEDDLANLPSGEVWSSRLDSSKQESMLIPFKNGHLAWSGSRCMNLTTGWEDFTIAPTEHYIDPRTDITRITRMRVDVEEQDGLQFPVDIQFNSTGGPLKGHATFTHNNKPAYINAEVWKEDDEITIRLNYDITAGIESNKLFIRDIVVC